MYWYNIDNMYLPAEAEFPDYDTNNTKFKTIDVREVCKTDEELKLNEY